MKISTAGLKKPYMMLIAEAARRVELVAGSLYPRDGALDASELRTYVRIWKKEQYSHKAFFLSTPVQKTRLITIGEFRFTYPAPEHDTAAYKLDRDLTVHVYGEENMDLLKSVLKEFARDHDMHRATMNSSVQFVLSGNASVFTGYVHD